MLWQRAAAPPGMRQELCTCRASPQMESPWPTDAALGRASSASTDAIPPDRQMFDACIARERPAECCSPAPLPPDPPLLPGNTANLPVGSVPAWGTDGVIQTHQGRAGQGSRGLCCFVPVDHLPSQKRVLGTGGSAVSPCNSSENDCIPKIPYGHNLINPYQDFSK